MKRNLFFLGILLLTVCGCAYFETKSDEKTAEVLAGEGMDYYKRGKYQRAIESFQQLKDWYPFSKYAILAELKIADAHYYLKEYDEAIYAYEEFENLHPRNEAIPYVIFQIGMCYFNQIDTVDRDQSQAKKALETFNRLIRQFPDDVTYSQKAVTHIKECKRVLAGYEFYVGMYYFKTKHYKSARDRFETVLTAYPDINGIHEKARHYLQLCDQYLEKEGKES